MSPPVYNLPLTHLYGCTAERPCTAACLQHVGGGTVRGLFDFNSEGTPAWIDAKYREIAFASGVPAWMLREPLPDPLIFGKSLPSPVLD